MLIRFSGEERNQWSVGGCSVLAIKHELVAFSHDELDCMFCEVNQGQWKSGNTSLFSTLCSWNHCCLYRYYVGRARVLSFVHRLTFMDITVLYVEPGSCSFVCRAKVFLYSLLDCFRFPYVTHIHCIFTLGQIHNEFDLVRIPLVGRVLRNMMTWQHLWKYSIRQYNVNVPFS